MNPSRVSNADIDTDYYSEDREKVREFLLNNDKFNASEIITFNTIALKGAIRDVGRALEIPLSEIDEICKNIETDDNELKYREKYKELFKFADLLNGVIVSIGTHPAGVLITEKNIQEEVGTCTLSTTEYPVSVLNMKELDGLFFVKLDILGLDNVGVINKTCQLLNIDRLTPDNVDLNDMDVWKSIRDDTTGIFQWESESASEFLKQFMSDKTLEKVSKRIKNFSMLKWFSFGNGLIRPACSSYRNEVAKGVFYNNGLDELNEFLATTMGRVTMQEDIMMFLVKFCGYSMAESDTVRRGIAKKGGTEKFLPEIRKRFVEYTSTKYKIPKEKCEQIIEPFLEVILSASSYAFSWNHSDSYSAIGYILGYLRYYYPLEFLTTSLNIFSDKEDKLIKLVEYCNKVNIKILPPKFRYSKADYMCDKETNVIYKGIASIKYLNENISNELYYLYKDVKFDTFSELLHDIKTHTTATFKQIKILAYLNYFQEFGKNKKIIDIIDRYEKVLKNKNLKEATIQKRLQELIEFESNIENKSISIKEQIEKEIEYYGYPVTKVEKLPPSVYIVTEINDKYTPKIYLYCLKTGEIETVKCGKVDMRHNPFGTFSILNIKAYVNKNKMKPVDGQWVKTEDLEKKITKWEVIA